MKDVFVTGTDTGVGKTVLSATLVAGLDAAYWKPIQSGRLGGDAETDRETVIRLTGLDKGAAPAEAYIFDPPVSPHLAARTAGVRIEVSTMRKPAVSGKRLIIEGAGGVLVPINNRDLMIDLMKKLDAAVVIATHTELGNDQPHATYCQHRATGKSEPSRSRHDRSAKRRKHEGD